MIADLGKIGIISMGENAVQSRRSLKRLPGNSGYVTQRENSRSLDYAELPEKRQFCSARDDNGAMKMSESESPYIRVFSTKMAGDCSKTATEVELRRMMTMFLDHRPRLPAKRGWRQKWTLDRVLTYRRHVKVFPHATNRCRTTPARTLDNCPAFRAGGVGPCLLVAGNSREFSCFDRCSLPPSFLSYPHRRAPRCGISPWRGLRPECGGTDQSIPA